MRVRWTVPVALSLILAMPSPGAGADASQSVVLTNVSHALDGRDLVVTGWVENRAAHPVARLVVDATGFAPSGEATVFGSDGIPWEIAPGRAERFAIPLPLREQLVRGYVVQISSSHPPLATPVSVSRSVDLAIYRPLLLSVVRLKGDIRGTLLTVRGDVERWPIAGVTVEATLLVPRVQVPRLETLVLDVPANRTVSLRLGIPGSMLLNLRVVDVRLKIMWAD
jgi:hypothetical protein